MATSESSSTASSPTLSAHSPVQAAPSSFTLSRNARRTNPSRTPSMSPIPENAPLQDETSQQFDFPIDQSAQYDVNHDIKTTLTDLLNCEAVRQDHKMRLWVQTRLLDAERELKRQRKRRVSTPTIVLSPSEDDDRRTSV